MYECYSYNQKEFLKKIGFDFEYSDTHRVTGKKFWVFKMNSNLSTALKAYSYHSKLLKESNSE